jgi:hypothetical protein
MHIQFNTQLDKHTAVDTFGVVIAIYDPAEHGSLADFKSHARSLVEA